MTTVPAASASPASASQRTSWVGRTAGKTASVSAVHASCRNMPTMVTTVFAPLWTEEAATCQGSRRAGARATRDQSVAARHRKVPKHATVWGKIQRHVFSLFLLGLVELVWDAQRVSCARIFAISMCAMMRKSANGHRRCGRARMPPRCRRRRRNICARHLTHRDAIAI